MIGIESVPTRWDAVRDELFFRIVAHVLPADLVAGASSLLAANDPELVLIRLA
jgi:hypothetical protein